jgi:hypothetical protein
LIPFILIAFNFIANNSNYVHCSIQSSDRIKNEIEKLDTGAKKIILTGSDLAESHIIYNNFTEHEGHYFFPFSKHDSVMREANVFCIVNEEEDEKPAFINAEKWEISFTDGALSVYHKPN